MLAVSSDSIDANGQVSIPDPNNPATWEMKYDANGNLKSDANKKITNITYNLFNQPLSIDFTGGSRIVYLYDGAGRRIKKTVLKIGTPAATTEYIANFVYQNNLPVYIHYSEGRVLINSGGQAITYAVEFYLTDHLGNTRVAFTRNSTTGQAELRQVTAYYPYGMNIRGLTTLYNTNKPNEYMYQGKEVDEELGLNWLDFDARAYPASRIFLFAFCNPLHAAILLNPSLSKLG